MIPVSGWVIFITELWEDLQENMSRPVFSLQISSPTYFLKGFFWTVQKKWWLKILCILVVWYVLKKKVVSIQTLYAWKTHLKFVKRMVCSKRWYKLPPPPFPDLEFTVISSAGTLQLNYYMLIGCLQCATLSARLPAPPVLGNRICWKSPILNHIYIFTEYKFQH